MSVYFSPSGSSYLYPSYLSTAQCPKVCCSLQSHCLSSAVSFCVCTSSLALPTAAYPHRPRPSAACKANSSIYLVFSRRVCGSCRGEMLNCRKCPRRCTGLGNVSWRSPTADFCQRRLKFFVDVYNESTYI